MFLAYKVINEENRQDDNQRYVHVHVCFVGLYSKLYHSFSFSLSPSPSPSLSPVLYQATLPLVLRLLRFLLTKRVSCPPASMMVRILSHTHTHLLLLCPLLDVAKSELMKMLKEVTSSSEDEDEEDISKLIFVIFTLIPFFLSFSLCLFLSPFLQLLKLQMMVGVVGGCGFYCDISFCDV